MQVLVNVNFDLSTREKAQQGIVKSFLVSLKDKTPLFAMDLENEHLTILDNRCERISSNRVLFYDEDEEQAFVVNLKGVAISLKSNANQIKLLKAIFNEGILMNVEKEEKPKETRRIAKIIRELIKEEQI